MSNSKEGGSAFPFGQTDSVSGQLINGWGSEGMTLRDYFAAKAMQGWTANPLPNDSSIQDVAAWAYRQADAMIKAREVK